MSGPCIVADLHTHTIYSDGELTPQELVTYYRQRNYMGLAITDHDTVAGVRQLMALPCGELDAIAFVPGVELTLAFDTAEFRGSLHLLLYFDASRLEDPTFRQDLDYLFSHARGPELLHRRITRLNEHLAGPHPGISLREEDFQSFAGQITRRALFQVLTAAGLPEGEARRLLANDSPAYIPSGVDLDTATDILRSHRWLRILAHPGAGSMPGDSVYKEVHPPLDTVRSIVMAYQDRLSLDGLELYYPAHTPSIRDDVRALAAALDLTLFTGGSDCHDLQYRPPGTSGLDRHGWARFYEALLSAGR